MLKKLKIAGKSFEFNITKQVEKPESKYVA
jgi:hypothetical protein